MTRDAVFVFDGEITKNYGELRGKVFNKMEGNKILRPEALGVCFVNGNMLRVAPNL